MTLGFRPSLPQALVPSPVIEGVQSTIVSAEFEWTASLLTIFSEALNLLCRLGTFSPHFGPFHFSSSDVRRSVRFPRYFVELVQSRAQNSQSVTVVVQLDERQLRMLAPASSSSDATNPLNQSAQLSFAFDPRKFPPPSPEFPFLGPAAMQPCL